MPHAAVGISLGVLAAGAITAIAVKEVIDNWDEIQDRYEVFADRIEHDHDLRLPRFRHRQQYRAHQSYSSASTHRSSDVPDSRADNDSTTTARAGPTTASMRSGYSFQDSNAESRIHILDDDPVRRSVTPPNAVQDVDEEEADFQAAIAASLETVRLTDSTTQDLNDDDENGDEDKWSETWTVTDATKSESGDDWSVSDHH